MVFIDTLRHLYYTRARFFKEEVKSAEKSCKDTSSVPDSALVSIALLRPALLLAAAICLCKFFLQ